MTSNTWQVAHIFWNGGAIRLVMNNILVTWKKKTICSNKKVNEGEHKHKESVKKGRSIKKEIKPYTHIHIICKQKEWNA
jgi:uncharacterized membrane protein